MPQQEEIRLFYTDTLQNKVKINAFHFTTFRSAVDSFLSTSLLREIAVANAVSEKGKSDLPKDYHRDFSKDGKQKLKQHNQKQYKGQASVLK